MTRRRLEQLDQWLHAGLWTALVVFAICGALAACGVLSGCSGAQEQQTGEAVRVLYVQGSGAVGVDVYGHPVEIAWREYVDQDLHCSVVDVLALDGVKLGSGYLPLLSDVGCAEVFPPFGRPAPQLVNAAAAEPLPPLSGP